MEVGLPAPDAVARFGRDLDALAPAECGTLGLAVSGGPDSLALLLLASAARPGRVEAATVDHGLRPEAAEEAKFVARLCATLGVPHAILNAQVKSGASSLQRSAREGRYAALADWMRSRSLACLATGHHLDDQAETLVMRLVRGSGVGGLAAMRSVAGLPGAEGLKVVRPLLGWRRAELAAIVEAAGIEPVRDPSNSDPRFDRVRIRAALADAPWLDAAALARSSAALAEADEAIAWACEAAWPDRVRREGEGLALSPDGLPAEILRRLLVRILAELSPGGAPRGEEIGRLAAALQAGGTATLAGVKCLGGSEWRFELAPPRREGA